MITLGEYKKRRKNKNRLKRFRGWVHLHSRTGSDWGVYDEWEVVSGPYPTRKEAIAAMMDWQHSDCCPSVTRKVYY